MLKYVMKVETEWLGNGEYLDVMRLVTVGEGMCQKEDVLYKHVFNTFVR